MFSSTSPKRWHPAQFTRAQRIAPECGAVVILNQPLENKDLLVEVCRTKGARCYEIYSEQQS